MWRLARAPLSTFSFDCIEMITWRNPQRTNKLCPAVKIYAPPRTEIGSGPKHRMSSKARSFTWNFTVTGTKKNQKAAKRESVLVPRERVVGLGHLKNGKKKKTKGARKAGVGGSGAGVEVTLAPKV